MPHLVISWPDGQRSEHAVDRHAVCTIGRAPWNSIELQGTTVSRDHARIVYRQGGFWLEDLASQNGTLLNGKEVTTRRLLMAGDRLQFGEYRAIYEADEAYAAVQLSDSAVSVATYGTGEHAIPPTMIDTPGEATAAESERVLFGKVDIVGQALIGSRSLSEIYQVIVDVVGEVLAADRVHLLLPAREGEGVVSKANWGSRKADCDLLMSQSIARQVLEERRATLISDAQHDERFRDRASVIQQRIQSAVCAPLWRDDEVLGVIYADKIERGGIFSVIDLHLLILVGHLAAVKIRESEAQEELLQRQQLEEELRSAAKIQRMLLPDDSLESEHLLVAGRFVPCHGVGGDYYDVLRHDDGSVTLVLADVAGKGMAAALLMAGLHARIHAYVEASLRLTDLVTKLNAYVIETVHGMKTATLFCAHLNPDKGTLEFVNAGHNAPILFGKNGEIRELKSDGMLLGPFPEATYTSRELEMVRGDLLVIYSDGVTEAETVAEEEFGQERLVAVLKEHAGAAPTDIVEAVMESVHSFSEPRAPRDDVTLLVARLI